MTNSEIESRIGNCERLFDLKRARVEQLSEELRSLENSLDRQTFETRREGVRVQIRRAECLLGSAKREMSEAHEALQDAWSMRVISQNSVENHADAVKEKRHA